MRWTGKKKYQERDFFPWTTSQSDSTAFRRFPPTQTLELRTSRSCGELRSAAAETRRRAGERRSEHGAQKARMGAEAARDADGGSRWS